MLASLSTADLQGRDICCLVFCSAGNHEGLPTSWFVRVVLFYCVAAVMPQLMVLIRDARTPLTHTTLLDTSVQTGTKMHHMGSGLHV